MRGHQGLQRLHHAGMEGGVALAALRQRVVGLVPHPAVPQVGMAAADGGHVQALQHAEALLAPQRVDHRHQAAGQVQRQRGALRALQVAAHQHVDRLTGQAVGQAVGLGQPHGIQGHVDLALKAVLAVPVGFAMANDDQFGHGCIVGVVR